MTCPRTAGIGSDRSRRHLYISSSIVDGRIGYRIAARRSRLADMSSVYSSWSIGKTGCRSTFACIHCDPLSLERQWSCQSRCTREQRWLSALVPVGSLKRYQIYIRLFLSSGCNQWQYWLVSAYWHRHSWVRRKRSRPATAIDVHLPTIPLCPRHWSNKA